MNAQNVSAEQMMNQEPKTVTKDMSIAQIKNRMEEEDLRAIVVVDEKNKLHGAISYRDLIRYLQFNPDTTNMDKVLHQPPEFDMEDNLVDLADLRINSGRKMLVHTSGNKVDGIVGDREFAEALKDTEEMKDVSTRDLCATDLITVFEEDSIDQARHVMMDNNVSTLPVLDNDGNLTGIIRSTDMLRALISREAIKAGGARGNRDGDEVKFPRGTEKESLSQVPVSELMDRMVNTSENHMNGQEAVENMLDNNQFDIVFVDGKYPETIIGIKDFIDHVAGMAPGKTVLVNLTGIDVPEEKAAIHEKIRKQLQGSLGRKLERAEEFDIRVKKAEKDGKKHRYEVDMKLSSEYGLTNINEEGWDLLEVIDEGLNEMNTVIRKEKEKREDRR